MVRETILLVGASNNHEKFGYIVLENLLNRGFDVIPINPNEEQILGVKAYKTISEFVKSNPAKEIKWVNFVVPPAVTVKLLEEVKLLKLTHVWFQPGSESEVAIDYCRKNDIHCLHHACIMNNYE